MSREMVPLRVEAGREFVLTFSPARTSPMRYGVSATCLRPRAASVLPLIGHPYFLRSPLGASGLPHQCEAGSHLLVFLFTLEACVCSKPAWSRPSPAPIGAVTALLRLGTQRGRKSPSISENATKAITDAPCVCHPW